MIWCFGGRNPQSWVNHVHWYRFMVLLMYFILCTLAVLLFVIWIWYTLVYVFLMYLSIGVMMYPLFRMFLKYFQLISFEYFIHVPSSLNDKGENYVAWIVLNTNIIYWRITACGINKMKMRSVDLCFRIMCLHNVLSGIIVRGGIPI